MSFVRRVLVEKRVALGVVGTTLVVNVLVYGLGVYPRTVGVGQARQRAASAAQGLAVGEANLRTARATLDGTTQAQDGLRRFYGDVLPHDLAGARDITYPRLASLANETHLVLERRNSAQDQDEDSELGCLRTTMLLAGDYWDIRRFIEALETAPEFIVIEEIVLTQREEETRSGQVLTLGVATYYRAEGGA